MITLIVIGIHIYSLIMLDICRADEYRQHSVRAVGDPPKRGVSLRAYRRGGARAYETSQMYLLSATDPGQPRSFSQGTEGSQIWVLLYLYVNSLLASLCIFGVVYISLFISQSC